MTTAHNLSFPYRPEKHHVSSLSDDFLNALIAEIDTYACEKLLSHLTEVVAVQRGVMIKTDSTYYQQVEAAAGINSAWTTYHRQVAGVDIPSNMPALKARGIAALHLYRETVKLLWDILVPEHREVIEQTLAIVDAAL